MGPGITGKVGFSDFAHTPDQGAQIAQAFGSIGEARYPNSEVVSSIEPDPDRSDERKVIRVLEVAMGLFVSTLKLNATAYSMHQFCSKIRDVFPVPVDDVVVEASTAFLYLQTVNDIMGKRFANRVAKAMSTKFKAPAQDVMSRVARLSALVDSHDGGEEFHEFITRVVRSMLSEAGCPTEDPQVLREGVMHFQAAMSPMKEHLMGIKSQNTWVLRRAS
ncbi:MAG: hypothetical protein O7G85_15975 [Planctomycetota bacterium]|nr:hypothetical protein [Planctomycetota bacterium]